MELEVINASPKAIEPAKHTAMRYEASSIVYSTLIQFLSVEKTLS
jgi:hypothetical protein